MNESIKRRPLNQVMTQKISKEVDERKKLTIW